MVGYHSMEIIQPHDINSGFSWDENMGGDQRRWLDDAFRDSPLIRGIYRADFFLQLDGTPTVTLWRNRLSHGEKREVWFRHGSNLARQERGYEMLPPVTVSLDELPPENLR